MPTIELISIDCPAVPDLANYPSFAYRAETELHSHRALFQPVFDSLRGVIVHLANKDLEGEEGCWFWFAGMIMDWSQTEDEACQTGKAMVEAIVRVARAAETEEDAVQDVAHYLDTRAILPVEHDAVLQFLPQTRMDVEDLMRRLLEASPIDRITFSTDYQFGGEGRLCGEVTLAEFLAMHDRREIRYNSLFFVVP